MNLCGVSKNTFSRIHMKLSDSRVSDCDDESTILKLNLTTRSSKRLTLRHWNLFTNVIFHVFMP
jgi:hypothetical protein